MEKKTTISQQGSKPANYKKTKAANGGGKNKNIGGQSGSFAKGKGESTGSKGTSGK